VASFPPIRRVVVGAVMEDHRTAHVVDRSGFETGMLDRLEVASLRRTDDGWRMRFNHFDFLGTASWGLSLGSEPEEEEPAG